MSLDEFCQTFKQEIDEDIKRQEAKKSVSMKTVIENAINTGVASEQVEQMDRVEQNLTSERNIEGVAKDE